MSNGRAPNPLTPQSSLDAPTLLRLCNGTLDTRALGQLVAILADWQGGSRSSRLSTHRLIAGSGLTELLFDAEFIEGVGPRDRLKTRRLVALAFRTAGPSSPAAAIRKLEALTAAGALNLYSSSAIEALHAGMAGWRGLAPDAAPAIKAELLARLCGELDTRAQAGLFLSLVFGSPASAMGAEEAAAVFRAVRSHRDVRDLAGDRGDLLAEFPPDLLSLLLPVGDGVGRGVDGAGSEEDDEEEEDDSDADSQGNLADFIAYSGDEDEEEEEEEEDDDDEGSENSGSSASESSSSRAGKKRPRQAAPPLPKAGKAKGSSGGRLKRAAVPDSSESSGSDGDVGEGKGPQQRRGPPPAPAAASKRRRYLDLEAGMGSRNGKD
jgi:hypothetical protein